MSRKLLGIRLWHDTEESGKWARSVTDMGYEILLISQFTLYHQMKGAKPSFNAAMNNEEARALYENMLDYLRT